MCVSLTIYTTTIYTCCAGSLPLALPWTKDDFMLREKREMSGQPDSPDKTNHCGKLVIKDCITLFNYSKVRSYSIHLCSYFVIVRSYFSVVVIVSLVLVCDFLVSVI